MKESFITEEERKKCQKVADALAELYEIENIVVLDVGRYGFVKLQYYSKESEFENDFTFTNSRDLFEDLWQEWRDIMMVQRAMDYDEIFNCLSEQEQKEPTDRKKDFAVAAGIDLDIAE